METEITKLAAQLRAQIMEHQRMIARLKAIIAELTGTPESKAEKLDGVWEELGKAEEVLVSPLNTLMKGVYR